MKNLLLAIGIFIPLVSSAQTYQSLNRIQPDKEFHNILVRKIAEDSLSSSFVIWIKQNVKSHFHKDHSENIVVLEGEGMMTLGDSLFAIKEGDFVSIPKGTTHSVTQVLSKGPLKVLSIQTPLFDGSDRIFIEQTGDY